jgi:pyruvate formate lyase activating enzyme
VAEGVVFDIQHYAVHDGPGIRTLVFLKGCPLRCAWCCNPESQAFEPELLHTSLKCRSHLACSEVCPNEAVRRAGDGPSFDRATCVSCNGHPCVDACPSGALSVAGTRMAADQVVARVAADRAFYINSGGGVTFSGGEPFAQPEFLRDLLARCKSLRIHTAVETCGYVEPGVLEAMEPLVDLFLFDLKVLDPVRHREATGVTNEVVLGNLEYVAAKRAKDITVRVPLVPGFTDDLENLAGTAAYLLGLGIRRVELMPYHPLGMDKYAALGRACALDGVRPLQPEVIGACVSVFRSSGLACEAV